MTRGKGKALVDHLRLGVGLIDIIRKVDNSRDVLNFLVTSRARRHLLQLLWAQEGVGSTAQLAAGAGVGFATAHRTLQAMRAAGLVVAERRGHARVYRANRDHPLAAALRTLVTAPTTTPGDTPEARDVRGHLAALGAPVQAEPQPPTVSVEETVVRGVHLAHSDPDVARTLPVCLFRQRNTLDPMRLQAQAKQLGEKHSLGFFLDLTAQLSGDRRFATWARPLRDRRFTGPHSFFHAATVLRSRRAQHLAEERTPQVARRWGWRMNLDLEAFRSTFEKFEPDAVAQ
jgi:hypothetical protein